MLDQQFWTNRYKNNSTGWDIGHPSPPLIEFAKTFPKNHSILIPGAGNGHEAIALANLGYTNITVVDISELPLQNLRAQTNRIHLIHDNFFNISGTFDLILEQTFFCALEPKLRQDYVVKMHELLKPKGVLGGVLFGIEFDKQGPPFGGSKEEYINYFSPKFKILKMENCYNSIPQRAGNELFFKVMKNISKSN